jgi:hypothetical protein
MGKAANILAGSVATAMIAVGIASLTGSVRWPTFSDSTGGTGAVHAQQASVSPSPSLEQSPSPSPSPTQAPAPPPPPPAPPPKKKHKD